MSERFDRIRTVMSAVLDVPPTSITRDSKAGDIENWDSLGQMNLMLALEEEFGVSFTPDQITGLLTAGEIEDAIAEAVN